MNSKAEIRCEVQRDQENVPEKMNWSASEGNPEGLDCQAALFSFWSKEDDNSFHLNLWTKEMTQEEMKRFTLNTLVTLAGNLEKATEEKELAEDLHQFAEFFAKKAEIST